MFDWIFNGMQDIIRNILWSCCDALINIINGLMEGLIDGVLPFSMFEVDFVDQAYNFFIAVMILYLPLKVVYEIIYAMILDDEPVDHGKKIRGVIFCFMLAIGVQMLTPSINTVAVNATSMLASNVNTDSADSGGLSSQMVASALSGFGGMNLSTSQRLVQRRSENLNYNGDEGSSFSITERDSENVYVYEFSELMAMIGLAIYVVLFFCISVQIASRSLTLIIYYVITPIVCTSLTRQNPQPFTIWKNTVFSVYAINFIQILTLQLSGTIVTEIGKIESVSGIVLIYVQAILYFAILVMILGIPPFIQGLLGGYGAGVMESVRMMSTGIRATRTFSGGALIGAGAVIGSGGALLSAAGSGLSNIGDTMRKRNNESKAASGIQTASRAVGRGGQMTKQAGNIAKTAGAMIAGRGGSFSHTSSSQHGFQISDAQSLSSTDANHSTQERSSSFSENNMMNRTDQFTGGQSQSNHFGQSSSPDAGVLRSASEQPKNPFTANAASHTTNTSGAAEQFIKREDKGTAAASSSTGNMKRNPFSTRTKQDRFNGGLGIDAFGTYNERKEDKKK